MKILIVDDHPSRYIKVIERFIGIGLSRDSIEIAPSACDARRLVKADYFDLLVLDILLPNYPEGEPNSQYSMDLLFELHHDDSGDIKLPGKIIGITADKDELSDKVEQFESLTWTIIHFTPFGDEWINQIVNCVLYLIGLEAQNSAGISESSIDVLVVCALQSPELDEVIKLPWNWSEAKPIDDTTFVHDGRFISDGKEYCVCATYSTRMGMVSAAILSSKLISMLKPKLVVMCGICAGVKGKVNIGDILLADPAWDFQSGKRVRDTGNPSFSIAPHQIQPSELVRSHAKEMGRNRLFFEDLHERWKGSKGEVPALHIGPVASGSAVLADGEVIDEIKMQHRSLLGVEMEVYGVYAAATKASHPQPGFLALKSVCDFADMEKADDFQSYASYTSANVFKELMERFGHRLIR